MAYLMIPAREIVAVTEESGSMFRVKSAMCSPMASIEARSAAFARNDKLASSLRLSCSLSGILRSVIVPSSIVALFMLVCNYVVLHRHVAYDVVPMPCLENTEELLRSGLGSERATVVLSLYFYSDAGQQPLAVRRYGRLESPCDSAREIGGSFDRAESPGRREPRTARGRAGSSRLRRDQAGRPQQDRPRDTRRSAKDPCARSQLGCHAFLTCPLGT